MSRPRWVISLVVAFGIVFSAAASASTTMLVARPDSAPAVMIEATFGLQSWLISARLENRSDKTIRSYTIGWAYVRGKKLEYHAGVPMNVPVGIKPKETQDVPDQLVPPDVRSDSVVFFVAEATFSDGSRWKVDKKDVESMARKNVTH